MGRGMGEEVACPFYLMDIVNPEFISKQKKWFVSTSLFGSEKSH